MVTFNPAIDAVGAVGFGGSDPTIGEDHQRGTMVFRLVEPDPPHDAVLDDEDEPIDLVARMTSVAIRSPRATGGSAQASEEQHASLIDIPSNAPTGTFKLHPIRRRSSDGDTFWASPLHYSIHILPHEIQTEGGIVAGTQTPLEAHIGGGVPIPLTSQAVMAVIPNPAIQISISQGCISQPCADRHVAATELDVVYDAGIISLEGVAHGADPSRTAWLEDDGSGSARIGVIAPDNTSPALEIDLLFSLVDGAAAILDPTDSSQIGVSAVLSVDEDGQSLADEYNITVSIGDVL